MRLSPPYLLIETHKSLQFEVHLVMQIHPLCVYLWIGEFDMVQSRIFKFSY